MSWSATWSNGGSPWPSPSSRATFGRDWSGTAWWTWSVVDHFYRTIGEVVKAYVAAEQVPWTDWEDREQGEP